jgi:rhodanese-related sulfurtransferase
MTSTPVHDDRLANARDVGESVAGVRVGVLLRSDAPLTDDVAPDLAAWPPATVLDLRDPTEAVSGHPLESVAAIESLPMLGSAGMTEMPDRLGAVYLNFLQPPTAAVLVRAITEIATAPTPVLVHCTAGKDRTGVSVAAALRLVGVDRAAIVADYARTAAAMPGVFERMKRSVAGFSGGVTLAMLPKFLIAAPEEAIGEFLDAFDAAGTSDWFLANGGTQETLDRLAARLLDRG